MNRHSLASSLILSATLGAALFHPAQAGGAINKCIDGAGRVTLTDQACDAHTVSSAIVVPGTPSDNDAGLPDNAPLPAQRTVTPLRQARWVPAANVNTTARAPMAADMATMKQARMQMMLQDAAPRTRLAAR